MKETLKSELLLNSEITKNRQQVVTTALEYCQQKISFIRRDSDNEDNSGLDCSLFVKEVYQKALQIELTE